MGKYRVGVISDTHGLLRDKVLEILKDSDLIIHAGDIGNFDLLEALGKKTPVIAVRGNCDKGDWAHKLNKTEVVEIGTRLIYVIHNINDLDVDAETAGFDIVISGHSHLPSFNKKNNVLFLNPGSAGPKRFKLPVSVAILNIDDTSIESHLFDLTE